VARSSGWEEHEQGKKDNKIYAMKSQQTAEKKKSEYSITPQSHPTGKEARRYERKSNPRVLPTEQWPGYHYIKRKDQVTRETWTKLEE